jgi:hypothetical protein
MTLGSRWLGGVYFLGLVGVDGLGWNGGGASGVCPSRGGGPRDGEFGPWGSISFRPGRSW